MRSPSSLMNWANPVVQDFIFYAVVLAFKMMVMSLLTGSIRYRKKAFANPEDAKGRNGKVRQDDDVERVRRAHLNDLENIPVFLVAAGLYVLTNPAPALALNLFRAFTAARIAHTLVYAVVVVPQPARAISWFVGYGITAYILVQNIISVL